MKLRNWLYPILVLIGVVLISSGSYELYPWQGAFVAGAGGQTELVTDSGWHWHWPGLTTVTRFDRRRHIFLSAPLTWVAFPGGTMRMRFLALWRITDPLEYHMILKASRKAAAAAIETQVRYGLSTWDKQVNRTQGSVPTPPALSVWLPAFNRVLARQGIRLSRLAWATLRWPSIRMKSLEQGELERWADAEAAIQADTRVKLDQVRSRAQAKLAALRLLETERSAEIVSTGLRDASSIEARARRLDPRFYDFYSELMLYSKTLKQGKGFLLLSPGDPWFSAWGSHAPHH
ncbi:MAG: SPFH domain-containing protein [Gammaproteobacteria bacterium]